MTVSPCIHVLSPTPDPALVAAGVPPDVAALGGRPVARLGGWEVELGPEDAARAALERCNASDVMGSFAHARMVGNDAGGRTAVVAWSPGRTECVFELDPEFVTAKPRGPMGVWLVHLALSEEAPSELAQRVLGWDTTPAAAPADPAGWQPEASVRDALKGGDHLGYAEVGGCVVTVHKKGLRAWIGGKKKSKALSKSASRHWAVSASAVWRFDDPFSGHSATRCGLPGLDVQTGPVRKAGAFAVLSDTHALCGDAKGLELLARDGDALVVVDAVQPGFPADAWFTLCGTGDGWAAMSIGDHVVLLRWTGERLVVEGGWRRGTAAITSAEGSLYTKHYAPTGWQPARLLRLSDPDGR
ncbi:MAG: hypothetical protein R3F61_33740 [Myxococcota bacterium]